MNPIKLGTPAKSLEDVLYVRRLFLLYADFPPIKESTIKHYLRIRKNEETGYYYFLLEPKTDSFVRLNKSTTNQIVENWEMFCNWDWKGEEDIEESKKRQRNIRKKYNINSQILGVNFEL